MIEAQKIEALQLASRSIRTTLTDMLKEIPSDEMGREYDLVSQARHRMNLLDQELQARMDEE